MAQTSKQAKHRKLRHLRSYQEANKAGLLTKKQKAWVANQGGPNGRFKQL